MYITECRPGCRSGVRGRRAVAPSRSRATDTGETITVSSAQTSKTVHGEGGGGGRTGRVPLGLALNLWDRMTTWSEAVEIARLADELGYEAVVLPESFARDGVTLCDRLLAATSRIHVCLGIANVFSRTPALLASTAATLDELSGGRFVLGLGASTPNLIEGWHGLRFERPMLRMRETIEIVRRVWARDRSPYEGRIFRTGGVKLGFQPVRERVPIWTGALLPKSLELCGELADGWMPTLLPVECIAEGRKAIARGAAKAGRDPASVTVAPTVQLLVHDEPEKVLPMLKFAVSIYYGPANSPYARAAGPLGYAADVDRVAAAYAEGGSAAAAEATSDSLARSLGVIGPIDACRQQIDRLLDGGADRVLVGMPAGTRAECEPILEGIVPERFR
jgi:alkanesulfonate monooxygenase SsuD/methylene tetrahydromethanopterin reductase-like flavin-dependent oxidoreductase (luciferase family)